MNSIVAEALAALPDNLDPNAAPLEDGVQRSVPMGRLQRGWILGSLQVRIAVGYLLARMRAVLRSEDGQARARNEANLQAAVRLLGTMGYLRGGLQKLGQALANYPTLVPDEFIDVLGALHFEAPPMHFSLLREMVTNELSGDPEAVFASFETRAFAAASLGQVHRARLRTGEEVAVKIQYPHIARTIQDDFRNLSLLLLPLRFRSGWEILSDQLEDVREMLERETDYRAEAELTQQARAHLSGLPEVVVPRVFEQHSTARVLTTEYLRGAHLDPFLAQRPSQELRDRHGRQLLEAVFRLFDRHGFVWTDPHPGNVLFLDDGKLGLIDFGSVRVFDSEEWRFERLMERALLGDEAAYREGLRQGIRAAEETPDDADELRLAREFCEWLWEPLRRPGPFDLGSPEYFPRGVRIFDEILRKRCTRGMPVTTWINRMFLGVRALCYRLGARVDVRAINDREMTPPAVE
jgi:predicted unusual protein kinase regulating ubiquinone biosynthesis (AarF/ABC1/UbiB family)